MQDVTIQVEHEQIIGDGLKQALQISPLSGSLFLGQQTLQGLRELANQRFQGGHGQLPDHPDLLAGQVKRGDRFTADMDWQHHQRSDTFLDQCRFLNHRGIGTMILLKRATASQSALTDHFRSGGIHRQVIDLGKKRFGQAPLNHQSIAAIRLAPIESAAVEFRQAQSAVQNGFQQCLPVRPFNQNRGKLVLRLQQQFGVLALGDVG